MPEKTVHLSEKDAETLESYAQEHNLTVDEVVQRFVASLRRTGESEIHSAVREITGLVPSDVDAEEMYGQHQFRKHGS